MNSVIHPHVKLGKNCKIEDFVMIGIIPEGQEKQETVIGDNALIRRGTIIYSGAKIGTNFQTGHNALIRSNNVIGNNVSIGSFTEIALRNQIRDNTRIHSGCFLEDVVLEKNVFIGPYVTFTNDPHPSTPEFKSCFKGAHVKEGVKIGGGVTILPHITIGKFALIGAGSVVVNNVSDFEVVVGNPAKKIKMIHDIECLVKSPHKPYENVPIG